MSSVHRFSWMILNAGRLCLSKIRGKIRTGANLYLLLEFSPSMPTSLLALLITLPSILRSRLDLQFEILALTPSNRGLRTLCS